MKKREYEIVSPKFKFHGEWRPRGDVIKMTEEEARMFKEHIKQHKKSEVKDGNKDK